MANIYLSSLFSCLVGVIRTVRCIPFSPIISAINAAQQDSSRAINTSPGPHTASTSSPRHSLMTEKKSNVFLPPFFLTFSQNHEKKSACLQKLHIHLAEKIHLHLSISHVLEGVRGNDRCLSDHPLAQVFVDCTRVTDAGSTNPLERECKRDTLSEFIINGSISYV